MVATPKINMEQKKPVKDSTKVDIETVPVPAPTPDPKPDEKSETASGLSDAIIRQKFILKVYGTLTIQMFFVILLNVRVLLFIMSRRNSEFGGAFVFVLVFSPIVLIPLTFYFKTLRRKIPGNLILLLVLSLTEAVVLGTAIIKEQMPALILFAGLILMVTLSIMMFALQTKLEFTRFRGIVLVFAVVFLLYGLCCRFLFEMFRDDSISGASFFACCFCLGLVCDTQRLLRIQGTDKLTPDDYIYTAFKIHLDMFNIFFLYTFVLVTYLILVLAAIFVSIEYVFGIRIRKGYCGEGIMSFHGHEHYWNGSMFHTFNDTDWMDLSSEVN